MDGSLPWPVRMRIAIETANALSYLHACGIIHRDVKSSNLLLDDHFCVNLADFCISRLFPMFVSHASTAPARTPGYLDPEYCQFYQLTEKSDVYSFGVVLIELIASKPAIFTRATDKIHLRRAFTELVDPSLGFESDDKVWEMIISAAKLAFQSLQRDVKLRPSMGEVMEFHGAGWVSEQGDLFISPNLSTGGWSCIIGQLGPTIPSPYNRITIGKICFTVPKCQNITKELNSIVSIDFGNSL